jgi:hypothetical protein
MTTVSRCIAYAKRAKSEGDIALHRFYLRKARTTINFNRGLITWHAT